MASLIKDNVTATVGNTPLVRLNRIGKGLPGQIAVKLEFTGPTCSVKDRAASAMIADAEKKGLIVPGKSVLLEATSGNMGIALAAHAQVAGYKLILLMPSACSIERRALMEGYGAKLILLDPSVKGKMMIERVQALAKECPELHWLNQFANSANADFHEKTTGPEIYSQTDRKVDIVVFGVGSGGTVTGVGRYLKKVKPEVEVFAVEPEESSVISGFEPAVHKIQGIGAGFVPPLLDREILDGVIRVSSDEALVMARRLATEESILGGISSGANVVAAVRLASRPENEGKLIVTTINSFGERYLSTALYAEMKERAEKLPFTSHEEAVQVAKEMLASVKE